MPKAIMRQWLMLQMIPVEPRKIDSLSIKQRLESFNIETSTRTIQRDLNHLSAIFPILCYDSERPYGWSFMKDGVGLNIPGIDPHTALTFELAEQYLKRLLPPTTLQYLQPYFIKSRKVLAELDKKKLTSWSDKIEIISGTQKLIAPYIDNKIINTVYDSLLSDKQIIINYNPRNADKDEEYTINPHGLVFRDSIAYLVCSMWNYNDIRHLALHRIKSSQLTNQDIHIPPSFNFKDYLNEGHFDYPTNNRLINLKVLFDKDISKHLYETPISTTQKMTKKGDYILVEAKVKDTAKLRWWLQAFGSSIEVVSPKSLRNEFIEMAEKIANKYKIFS